MFESSRGHLWHLEGTSNPFGAFHDHFHDGRDESFILHVEQSIAAITGRQLQNRRVVDYRSSTISDDVGVRQGYVRRVD